MASRERADQEKVADVCTGNEKHAASDDQRNAEGWKKSASSIKGGLPQSVQLEIARAVGGRIIVFEPAGNRGDFGLGLREGHPGPAIREAFYLTGVAIFELVSAGVEQFLHGGGDPEAKRVADERAIKSFGSDADNGVLDSVQHLGAADNGRIARVALLPGEIGDHGYRVRVAAGVLTWLEASPHEGTDTEGIEIVSGDDAAGGAGGAVAAVERGAHDAVRDEGVDQGAVPLEVLKVGPGDVSPLAAIHPGDGDQAILCDYQRERAEKDSFNPTEDRSGRADPQHQAEDREDREAGAAAEQADAEDEILKHIGIIDGLGGGW